ncbi:MAG: GGDEF domain-containing protein [Lachnospiraceae bacterium]|nr:GGDEF domain-containing protein [Lachnospiraceae bacterium]
MNNKKFKIRFAICLIAFFVIAILIEVYILSYANQRQVQKTSEVILNHVEGILEETQKSEEETLAVLKEEYVQKANTVAYFLDNKKEAIEDVEELKKLASLMGIDEINLFDTSGVIYAGTHPEYYGLSFEDGEQVAFFKPMLLDKTLTMCQGVTPNTAENKSMMYAITWDSTGTYMVQVGIEPVRLLEELKENSIYEVVRQMPAYEGVSIYVADKNSKEILGSTNKDSIGQTLVDIGILDEGDDSNTIESKNSVIDGFKNYCHFRLYDDCLITVAHSTNAYFASFVSAIAIEIAWLIAAASVISYILFKLIYANEKINDQMEILTSLSDIYYSMHLVHMTDFSIEKIEANSLMDEVVENGKNASDMLRNIVETTVDGEYKNTALEFVNLYTLSDRLRNKNSVFIDVVDNNVGWLRISFIVVEKNEAGALTKVMITTQVVDEDKKKEEDLIDKANKDELTGLYNRRAYEDDILNYPTVPPEPNFVYISVDVNGLKVINDTLGHIAGDELIEGAAECLKRALGSYGKIYRTGGDEFVSMIFADENRLELVLKDLEQVMHAWSGVLVKEVSMSVGCATKREFAIETVDELATIAEKRMYEAKAKYYSQKGVDRRGQAAAHTALCNLYTKILKINLTTDAYNIVGVDESEQTEAMGFSTKISEWLSAFGKTGQVHKDDLDEYLRQTDIEFLRTYFKGANTSLSIFYRRKFGDDFKQVMMEIIPADDYENDNQSLYLYVKSIDN